MKKELLTERDV